MKKKNILITFFFVFILSLFLIPAISIAQAADNQENSEEDMTGSMLDREVDKTLSKFDLSEFESLLDLIEQENNYNLGTGVKELFSSIINGDNKYSFGYFLNLVFSIFLGELKIIIPTTISILIIGILYGIMKNMTDSLTVTNIRKIVYVACYGVILALIMYLVTKSIMSARHAIEIMSKFINVSFPILLTLITSLGGAASVGIYQPLILVLITVIFKIIETVIFPLFYAALVFGLISEMSDNIKLDKLSKTTKSAANWILGIVFSIFITFTTAQGITGASFDSLAARGAKYALSSYVPVIGNYLKEGFDLVLASCIVIKNALGLSSIIILVFITLFPLIKLITIIFAFRIMSAVIEPLSDKKFANMLYSASSALSLLVTIIICISFTVLIMFMLIIYTCNWGIL